MYGRRPLSLLLTKRGVKLAKNGVNRVKLIALSGIVAALSVVVMLAAYFPWFTYAMPAIAGCFHIMLVSEAGKKHALAVFAVVAVLSFFICEKESWLCYTLFFGFYPIAKALIEKIPSKAACWVVKLILFNVCFTAILLIAAYIITADVSVLSEFGVFTIPIFLATGNIMFIMYDICLTKLVMLYMYKLRVRIHKLLK